MSNAVPNKVLEVKELRQYFKVGKGKHKFIVKAVDNVTFDVFENEVFGLVGESGSGKTTTGRTIIRLYKATGGKVVFNGNLIGYGTDSIIYDIKKMKKQRRIDIIAQNNMKKEIYDKKQDTKKSIEKLQLDRKANKSKIKADIKLANEPIIKYDDEVNTQNRDFRMQSADIQVQNYQEITRINEFSWVDTQDDLDDFLLASKERFAKKCRFLKDIKISSEEKDLQYNVFIAQYAEELKATYDLYIAHIKKSEQLMYYHHLKNIDKKFFKVTGKLIKSKHISEKNIGAIKDLEALISQDSASFDTTKSEGILPIRKSEHLLKEQIKAHKIEVKKQTKALEASFSDKISQISKPDRSAIKSQIASIQAQGNAKENSLKDLIKQATRDFENDEKQIRQKYKSFPVVVDQQAVKKINDDYYETLKQKRVDLNYARSIKKFKDPYNVRKSRKNQIKLLTKSYKDSLIGASEDNKKILTDNYNREVKLIKATKLSYRNTLSTMQMIFQDPISSLNPMMTVRDIIGEALIIKGVRNKQEREKKIIDILNIVGLQAGHADRLPHEFSGGQRQRIGIARALVIGPKLIIADEPISALDVSIQAQIINLLNDLKNTLGLTILFIAHDLSVVKFFSDRIAVMYSGKIVELTTAKQLFANPLHPYTKSLLSAIPEPDPDSEATRQRTTYNPFIHNYFDSKPSMQEVYAGHYVYGNDAEIEAYRAQLKLSQKEHN